MLDKHWNYRRGDLYLVGLNPFKGSEQGGTRPVVVLSNNIGNRNSTTLIVAPLTTQPETIYMPTHVHIRRAVYSKTEDSTIMLEQLRTIDKERVEMYVGKLSREQMTEVEIALMISVGLLSRHIPQIRKAAVGKIRRRRRGRPGRIKEGRNDNTS